MCVGLSLDCFFFFYFVKGFNAICDIKSLFLLRSINKKTPVIPGFNNVKAGLNKHIKRAEQTLTAKRTPKCMLTALGRYSLGEK